MARTQLREAVALAYRWTLADLDAFPDDGKRYEIIDGELYVSKAPDWYHQLVCGEMFAALHDWSRTSGAGVANLAPGLIFADDDNVVPDAVWLSNERLAASLEADDKLHSAPDLVIEVLSPGSTNERRDREAKLGLYSRRGVQEYWIVDWLRRQVEIYRRAGDNLTLAATVLGRDTLRSPLLPGFACPLSDVFRGLSGE